MANNGNLADDDDLEVKPVKKTRAKRVAKVVTKDNRQASVAVLTGTLVNINNFIAGFTGASAFMLDESEGRVIAESLVAVANEIDVEISPLNQAILNATLTIGMVYGLKYAAHKASQAAKDGDGDNGVSEG